ncbi:DNA double-strand break repair Rad50 ATPase [Ceratobasidium sp. AG-Ba]|nr:DNA double-strand break repair Rad50 ATPase [Ceratobasidium sp. AG-Ba]
MPPVQLGTYRIISVASGTCIKAHNDWEAVCWKREDENKEQQWYVQRSGEGYRIQNCLHGTYLSVCETKDMAKDHKVKVFWA